MIPLKAMHDLGQPKCRDVLLLFSRGARREGTSSVGAHDTIDVAAAKVGQVVEAQHRKVFWESEAHANVMVMSMGMRVGDAKLVPLY